MAVRKHYITICFKGNTVVTHIAKNGTIEVTFEQAVKDGFNTLIADIDSNVISNNGFNNADVEYFRQVFRHNRSVIIDESRGVI